MQFARLNGANPVIAADLNPARRELALRLGADLINLGLSGACHVEPELSDWMASLDGWDLAVFELGINALGPLVSEEFRGRVDHLLEVFTSRHPEKPLVLLTIFPSWYRPAFLKDPGDEKRDTVFCDILRELYGKYRTRGNLHLVEGSDILDDCCYVCYSLGNFCFGGNMKIRALETMVVQADFVFSDEGAYKGSQLRLYPAHIATSAREEGDENDFLPKPVTGDEALAALHKVQNDTPFDLGLYDEEAGCLELRFLPAGAGEAGT